MCVLKLIMMTIYSQGTIRRGTDRCRLLGAAEKPDAKKQMVWMVVQLLFEIMVLVHKSQGKADVVETRQRQYQSEQGYLKESREQENHLQQCSGVGDQVEFLCVAPSRGNVFEQMYIHAWNRAKVKTQYLDCYYIPVPQQE